MNAKRLLFVSSIAIITIGVAALATLGAVAKVPGPEYWTVVLGAVAVGGLWLALLSVLHVVTRQDHTRPWP